MRLSQLLFAILLACSTRGATPPAGHLLPADTLVVLSVPDWDKATIYWDSSPYGRLWQEPSMKPFKEHLLERLDSEFNGTLRRQVGMSWTNFAPFLHGQVTF